MSSDFRRRDDDDDVFADKSADGSVESSRAASARPSDESSLAAIIRQQGDRPIEELDRRLQALRARALSAADPETDPTAPPQALYDVDDVLVAPEIVHKPGGVISAAALSKAQKKQVELLKDIVGGSLETGGAPRQTLLAAPAWPRLLTALVIFLAVTLPFVSSDFNIGDLPPAAFGDDDPAHHVFTLMDSLAEGDWALVGFEYGPTAAGELDALADVLLRHLFAQGAKPIVVSSNPVAVVHAQNVLNDIRRSVQSAGLRLEAGKDYYLLRYLTGGALGLRDLSQNFDSVVNVSATGHPTSLNLTSLDEMALMLLIAERAEDIRNWAEQVAPATDTELVAAAGYAAQPLAEPYVSQSAGIAGLLVGIRDAYTYGEMLQDRLPPAALAAVNVLPSTGTPPPTAASPPDTPPPTATAQPTATATPNPAAYVQLRDRRQEAPRLDAITLGTMAAALIILFGNLYFGLRALLRRRPKSKSQ